MHWQTDKLARTEAAFGKIELAQIAAEKMFKETVPVGARLNITGVRMSSGFYPEREFIVTKHHINAGWVHAKDVKGRPCVINVMRDYLQGRLELYV